MINSIANGKYLLKSIGIHYTIKREFGVYRVYHNEEGFIATANTQRECRNAMRAFTAKGIKTIEGRE